MTTNNIHIEKLALLIENSVFVMRVLTTIFRVFGAVIIVANSLTGAASTQPYFDGLTFIAVGIILGYSAKLIEKYVHTGIRISI